MTEDAEIAEILAWIVEFVGDENLINQIEKFNVGERESDFIVEIILSQDAPRSNFQDGPLPGRFIESDPENEYLGEILIWISDGFISAIEYASISDSSLRRWPKASNLHLSL